MSEWVIPVEEETGVPLTIVPHEDLPVPGTPGVEANYHHLFYPKTREELRSEAGKVLRPLMIQWVDRNDHDSFHHYFDDYMAHKWHFPQTMPERVGMVVLVAAHYVAPRAIRISREGPSYVELDEAQRQNLWDRKILKNGGESTAFEFLKNFILSQELTDMVDESKIEKFIYTEDSDERTRIGNTLITVAARAATEHVRPTYMQAYRRRLIMPGASAEPQSLVMESPSLLGTEKRKRKTRTELRFRLAQHYGIDLRAA